MPEPIIKQDGTAKNDCERNAAKRFITKLRQDHPHLKFIVTDLTEEDHREYYNGFANRTLWPLLHFRLDLVDSSTRLLSPETSTADLAHFVHHQPAGPLRVAPDVAGARRAGRLDVDRPGVRISVTAKSGYDLFLSMILYPNFGWDDPAYHLEGDPEGRTVGGCGDGDRHHLGHDRDPRPIAQHELDHLEARWPKDLPPGVIHADLFPDNVLMLGDAVSGMIDFYFACNEAMAYDLAVTHAAWSFDRRGSNFAPAIGAALIDGYDAVRPLQDDERAALPVLAQGACLRFVASRAEDWLDTPADALVTRKDPMDYVRRLNFYAEAGQGAFAS